MSETTVRSDADTPRRAETIFSFVALAVAAIVLSCTLYVRGLTVDPDTQAEYLQALSIRQLGEDGFQVAYPVPAVGYPWSVPRDFGVHVNAASLFDRLVGWGPVASGRSVSLIFFLLSVPAVYAVARALGLRASGARIAVALWLVSPFAREHAVTLTGAMVALAFGSWWLWGALALLDVPRLLPRIVAVFAGAMAAACQPVVFAPLFVAIAVWIWRSERRPHPIDLAVIFGPALVAGLAWGFYAANLRAAHPYGDVITQTWGPVFGSLAERCSLGALRELAGNLCQLISPLALIVVLAFGGLGQLPARWKLGSLTLAALLAAIAFAPAFRNDPGTLAAAGLLATLVLAVLVHRTFGFATELRALPLCVAVLALFGQAGWRPSQPAVTPSLELPRAREFAAAVATATRQGELVVTLGQDWDPRFLFWTGRRGISVPAGRENDFASLRRALGPGSDRRVGAVVITGRYRSEPGYAEKVAPELGVALPPLLRSDSSEVYVPANAVEWARDQVYQSDSYVFLAPDPNATPTTPAPEPEPVAAQPGPPPDQPEPFSMMNPQPARHRVPYDLSAHMLDGRPHFFAHAPTDLEFDLAPGNGRLEMEFFMSDGSYTGAGNSDGTEIIVSILHQNGRTEQIYRHALNPAKVPADRNVVSARVEFNAPRGGILRVEVTPGPEARANFDWVYIRRLVLR